MILLVADKAIYKTQRGVLYRFTKAIADTAINGTSFEDALKNSLRSSLVDVLAAQTFSELVKPIDADTFARNLTHKLMAAGVGCVTAEAKQQSCDAGALGAAVGEVIGDYLVEDPNTLTDAQRQQIINIGKLTAGSVALLANVDVDTAANAAGLAVENNSLNDIEIMFPNEDFRDPNFSKNELEAIKRLPDTIASVHNYYNDMTIASFSAGLVGYTIVINNKNGSMYITGVTKINKNGQTTYSAIPEVGIIV